MRGLRSLPLPLGYRSVKEAEECTLGPVDHCSGTSSLTRADDGARTRHTLIGSQVLYRLSYVRKMG